MKKFTIALGVIVIVGVIVTVSVFGLMQRSNQSKPELSANPLSNNTVNNTNDVTYLMNVGDFVFSTIEEDLGVVRQSGGLVTREFPFEYRGSEPITVTGVPASCSCTTAKISQTKLKPGDQGMLTVTFDPNLHEEPVGRFYKSVSIITEPALAVTPEVKIWMEIDLDLGPQAYKQLTH